MNATKLKFFIQPIIIAILLTFLWIVLNKYNLLADFKYDTDIMASGTVNVLGIFYALVAAFVLSTVWRQFVAVEESVKLRNKIEFIKHKDKRIPLPIKILLLIFSLLLLGSFFVMRYEGMLNGVYSIFAIGLGLALNWGVIMDLDDPFEGIWNIKIPNGWEKLRYVKHIKNGANIKNTENELYSDVIDD
jgi:hypothetical protein